VTSQPAIHHPLTAIPSTELAIRGDQQRFDKYQLAALRAKGIENVPNPELAVFFHYCKSRGLDPFSGHATMTRFREKDGTDRWTIITEIDGFRYLGHRAANAHGDVIAMPEPVYVDTDGNEHKHWVRNEPPGMVIVTILKNGAPFAGEANYFEFRKLHPRTGEPMGLWAKMPANQTRKCAEAQAWRMAYQSEFTDIPIELAVPVAASPIPEHEPVPDRDASRRWVRQVALEWDRIGVTTEDELLNLTAALAGTDTVIDALQDVADNDLRRIAGLLINCENIADVHQLISNGDAPSPGDDPALD
jgi:phage recombination protein Bet